MTKWLARRNGLALGSIVARYPSMISQARHLKELLKKYNIAARNGKLSVRTKKTTRMHGYYEYGAAVAHVRELTDEEIAKLVNEDKYLDIYVYRSATIGFSIVKSSGSNVIIVYEK